MRPRNFIYILLGLLLLFSESASPQSLEQEESLRAKGNQVRSLPDDAWKPLVLGLGRRILSAEDLEKENVEVNRDPAAYLKKHGISVPKDVTITGVMFLQAVGGCRWVWVGTGSSDDTEWRLYEYICSTPRGPVTLKSTLICEKKKPEVLEP